MSGLFGGGSKSSTPKVEAPVRMPDPDDPALIEARKQEIARQLGRGGRMSTILTTSSGSTLTTGSEGKAGA